MATFLTRSRLGKGDLRLYLTNQSGYPQDAASVRWTIFSQDGRQVSGKDLSAIKAQTGEYYAPWESDVANGNYRITWKIQPEWGSTAFETTENFFVVDPSSYSPFGPYKQEGVPIRGAGTYLTGTLLGRGDLPLFLTDESGPSDADSVIWTILDSVGRAVSDRTVADRAGVGEYFASWLVNVGSGDYEILWEWQKDSSSPLQSQRMRFSVILSSNPYAIIVPENPQTIQIDTTPKTALVFPQIGSFSPYQVVVQQFCSGGGGPPIVYPPPVNTGSPPEVTIPRVVHLASALLPASGNFTNQPAYILPQGVHSVTFYVTYTYGAPGGYSILRLLWGDGTTEFYETLLDNTINITDPTSNQNLYVQEFDSPRPSDSNPINFMVETSVPGGARSVRLIAAEKGNIPNPGILGITLTASSVP